MINEEWVVNNGLMILIAVCTVGILIGVFGRIVVRWIVGD